MRRRTFGSVFLRKGRDGLWIQFHHRGKRYLRYGGRTKSQGEKKLRRIDHLLRGDGRSIQEALADVFPDSEGRDQPERVTFELATAHYQQHARHNKKHSTIVTDRQRFNLILRTSDWGDRIVKHIDTAEIQRWADKRCETGTGGPTVNRDVSLLRAFFRWAMSRGYCYRNPVDRVQRYKENAPRDCCLTLEETNRLIAAAHAELRPAIVVAIGTGMRRGEQLSLRWCDVDMEAATIRIRPENDKTRIGRDVPMSEPVLAAMGEFRSRLTAKQNNGIDPVCVRFDGQPMKPEWMRVRYLVAKRNAELPGDKVGLRWHDLRRVAATLMLDGSQLPHVSRVLGHKAVTTTMRYLKTSEEAKRAAVNSLGARLQIPRGDAPAS